MDTFLIKGPCKVIGKVNISGSKNAALPILAATLLFDKPVELKNLPNVRDIQTMLALLKSLGSKIKISKNKNSVKIYNRKKMKTFASYNLVKTMRAGILVLGPLLSKYHKSITSLPGGCSLGTRPINYHLKALNKLGAKHKIIKGYVHATAKRGLVGGKIKFPKISVGASQNLIIAATLANGKTVLKNCAIEPEIKDLVNFLNSAGGKLKWIGKRTLQINGVKFLNSINYSIMSDRIETGTWLIVAAITEGKLKIGKFNPKLIQTEINILKKIGAKIKTKRDEIYIQGNKNIKSINLKTEVYPGFPTDLQAQMMALLCKANGRSEITENIFEHRYMHVAELRRMGAKIKIKGSKSIIEGNTKFEGTELMSTDLRASVSLVLAALSAKGKSIINRVYHLDRGYDQLEKKLMKVGVKIKRIS